MLCKRNVLSAEHFFLSGIANQLEIKVQVLFSADVIAVFALKNRTTEMKHSSLKTIMLGGASVNFDVWYNLLFVMV